MQNIYIHNFQDLQFPAVDSGNKPFDESTLSREDHTTVVIVRDPYAFFDRYLHHCIINTMSPTLSRETVKMMKRLDEEAFLAWFITLNYLPLVNPQTFQLDMRKRLDLAIANLESFNYVVPYEEIDTFANSVIKSPVVSEKEKNPLAFSIANVKEQTLIETTIGKDIELYQRAKVLWEISQNHDFKPLHTLIENRKPRPRKKRIATYIGLVDNITDTTVVGWVFREEDHEERLEVAVYKNSTLLQKGIADIYRPGVQKLKGHATGLCGFHIRLTQHVLSAEDSIEIKVLPENRTVPLSQNAKRFFAD